MTEPAHRSIATARYFATVRVGGYDALRNPRSVPANAPMLGNT